MSQTQDANIDRLISKILSKYYDKIYNIIIDNINKDRLILVNKFLLLINKYNRMNISILTLKEDLDLFYNILINDKYIIKSKNRRENYVFKVTDKGNNLITNRHKCYRYLIWIKKNSNKNFKSIETFKNSLKQVKISIRYPTKNLIKNQTIIPSGKYYYIRDSNNDVIQKQITDIELKIILGKDGTNKNLLEKKFNVKIYLGQYENKNILSILSKKKENINIALQYINDYELLNKICIKYVESPYIDIYKIIGHKGRIINKFRNHLCDRLCIDDLKLYININDKTYNIIIYFNRKYKYLSHNIKKLFYEYYNNIENICFDCLEELYYDDYQDILLYNKLYDNTSLKRCNRKLKEFENNYIKIRKEKKNKTNKYIKKIKKNKYSVIKK